MELISHVSTAFSTDILFLSTDVYSGEYCPLALGI